MNIFNPNAESVTNATNSVRINIVEILYRVFITLGFQKVKMNLNIVKKMLYMDTE
jgi:hypothetical protein